MTQAVHIFKKDARHLWLEIAITLAIALVVVLTYPSMWNGIDYQVSVASMRTIAGLASALLPLSWWILLIRLVHEENLVGDKQWWITKPYEWPQLLAGKVLFVLVFVAAPLVVLQCVLLWRAGFEPWAYAPGLAFDLLLVAVVLLAPLAALATVVSTFARIVLVALGVVLAVIANFAVLAWARVDTFAVSSKLWWLALTLFFPATILVQYARRRAWMGRLLLVAMFAFALVLEQVGYLPGVVAGVYPLAANGAGTFSLSVDGSKQVTASPAQALGRKQRIGFDIPVLVSGLSDDDAVDVDAVRVTVQAPQGRRWNSPWENEFTNRLIGSGSGAPLDVRIDRGFLEQVKSEPLRLQVQLAITELRKKDESQVTLAAHDFAVPGLGICTPERSWGFPGYNGITCRAALREPQVSYLQVRWSDDPCTASTAAASGVTGAAWVGDLSTEPAALNLSAVSVVHPSISNSFDPERTRKPGKDARRFLCPGTPITFTRYGFVRRTQYEMTIVDFHVPSWTIPGVEGTAGFAVRAGN